jgi:predicted ABC-type ATPase
MNRADVLMLQKLIAKYELSEADYQEILQDIIRDTTYKRTRSEKPTVIILGAQPGAGKTELQKEAESQLAGNAVICNADNFRDYHPLAHEIKRDHPSFYPDVTAALAQRWNDSLVKHCVVEKLNFILETTFSSGRRLNQTIYSFKEAGYQVDVMLLAVSPKLSLLGTYLRYEHSIATIGTGRQVSQISHDSRFEMIPRTIASISQLPLFDNFSLYARGIAAGQQGTVEGVVRVAVNPANIYSSYQAEVNRPWSDEMTGYFQQKVGEVVFLMQRRNAKEEEVQGFREALGLEMGVQQRKRRRLGL